MSPTSVAEWGWCLTASTSGLRWWDFPQLAGLAFFLVREVKGFFGWYSSASRMEVWQGTCGGNERVFILPPALLSSKGYMRGAICIIRNRSFQWGWPRPYMALLSLLVKSQQDSSLLIQEPRSVLRSKRPFLNFFEDLCCLRLVVRS